MVVSIALEGYGPLTVACARTTLGAVTLLLLVLAMGRPPPQIPSRLGISGGDWSVKHGPAICIAVMGPAVCARPPLRGFLWPLCRCLFYRLPMSFRTTK